MIQKLSLYFLTWPQQCAFFKSIAVTNYSGESSFSTLKSIKSYLRSSLE